MTRKEFIQKAHKNIVDFRDVDLRGVDLSNLHGEKFHYLVFAGADLSGADLSNSSFRYCVWGENGKAVNLSKAKFNKTLLGTHFEGCDLSGLDFTGCDLSGCRFDGCDLSGSVFDRADMRNCSLKNVKAAGATFRMSRMGNGVFSGNFKNSIFDCAEICCTQWKDSNLDSASFDRCEMLQTDFRGAQTQQTWISPYSGAIFK